MSSTTRKRTLRAAPARLKADDRHRTDAEDKLWQALHSNPDSTAAALCLTAGIGKSTGQKILARWETEGLATRTAADTDDGRGRRSAARWAVVDTPDATAETGSDRPSADDQPPTDEPDEDQPVTTATEPEPHATGDGAGRLAPGALRGMVEDHLRAHPGAEFSPNSIGKTLGRSSGAVHNALETLVQGGYAARTSNKPKKYSLAPVTDEPPGVPAR